MKLETNKIKRILLTILIAGGFFVFGLYIGFNDNLKTQKVIAFLGSKDATVKEEVDFTNFWKIWNAIDKKFPDASKVGDDERMYGAMAGMVESLNDPYSVFFKPDEAKKFKEEISGSFSGVGMEVGIKDGILTVIAPLKGTPADKIGIKPGDKVLQINDTKTSGMSTDEAVKLIRGPKGTIVKLTIGREGDKEPKEFKITRDNIEMPTLDIENRDDGIFVIKLYVFSSNSLELFRNAMKEFVASKKDKLVLDLRNNPGGYLDIAVDVSSWFLPSGKVIVTEQYGNNTKAPKIYRSLGYNPFNDKLKMVVLVNEGSASASEIVAGALQDYKRAKLVGEQSFGKGSVQEVINIDKESLLKITVAKWLTPNGTSISEKGLTPDIKVPYNTKDKQNNKDIQLDKAFEILKNWNSY